MVWKKLFKCSASNILVLASKFFISLNSRPRFNLKLRSVVLYAPMALMVASAPVGQSINQSVVLDRFI